MFKIPVFFTTLKTEYTLLILIFKILSRHTSKAKFSNNKFEIITSAMKKKNSQNIEYISFVVIYFGFVHIAVNVVYV